MSDNKEHSGEKSSAYGRGPMGGGPGGPGGPRGMNMFLAFDADQVADACVAAPPQNGALKHAAPEQREVLARQFASFFGG